jgi:hypothetical protein
MSGPVPGVNGTTMVMVRPAVCPKAPDATASAAENTSATPSADRLILQIVMAPSWFVQGKC